MKNKVTKQNQPNLTSLQLKQVETTSGLDKPELLFNKGSKQTQEIKKMSKG